MSQATTTPLPVTIGLDLGSRTSQFAICSPSGEWLGEGKVATTAVGIRGLLERHGGARLVMEASTPSRWIHDLGVELGSEVVVANPRSIPVITASVRKSDRNDARLLAQLGQLRPDLLNPVVLRDACHQEVRSLLFARQQLVEQRTALINFVRAQARMLGENLPSASTRAFVAKCTSLLPASLSKMLEPLLQILQAVGQAIRVYDERIEQLCQNEFAQTAVLQQINGVGPLAALCFVATIGDPARFSKSRQVGPYLGLVPRSDQSCGHDPDLPITRCGDTYMRTLLVSVATRILGPFGQDSDLRSFGLRIAAKGGKRSMARARIAVARKLAVLMHRLLVTGEVYRPLSQPQAAVA
jgi:transposase